MLNYDELLHTETERTEITLKFFYWLESYTHCLQTTIDRHTNLIEEEKKYIINIILSNYIFELFHRGPFTICQIIDTGNQFAWPGITKQHPNDVHNIQYGNMIAFQRAVLELIRDLFGKKAIKTTLYGKKRQLHWTWTLQDKPLIAISNKIK